MSLKIFIHSLMLKDRDLKADHHDWHSLTYKTQQPNLGYPISSDEMLYLITFLVSGFS